MRVEDESEARHAWVSLKKHRDELQNGNVGPMRTLYLSRIRDAEALLTQLGVAEVDIARWQREIDDASRAEREREHARVHEVASASGVCSHCGSPRGDVA